MQSIKRNIVRLSMPALFVAALGACDNEPLGEPSPRITELLQGQEAPVVLQLPDGDTLHLSGPVVEFYNQRGFRQAWTDYDEIYDSGWALLEAMERAIGDGLDPNRYRFATALSMVQQVEEDSIPEPEEPGQMSEVDLVLSEVFGRYANDLVGGVLDPNAAGLEWNIPRDSVDVLALLERLAGEEDPQQVLESLRPEAPEYDRLGDALEHYEAIVRNGGWPQVPENTPTEVGASGPGVAALRTRIIREGAGEEAELARAGEAQPDRFDEQLGEALQRFQQRHGLDADGAVGPSTLEELNVTAEQRLAQIRLNLDQWRWLPQELGERYILVNVAGFEMEFVDQGETVLAMNVVVGQEGWETPIFVDTMESIVVNPYWNVPPSIHAEEVWPAAMRDPGYLARNNMEIVRGNQVVDPGAIDLSSASPSSGYRFRQRPGDDNALGQVKFLFPNDDNIYLHDTPADQYFSRTSRAFSHGCIRLEKPLELARVLFERVTDQSPDALDDLLQADSERWVRVTETLPVYILYFTAWANEDGTVQFYPDVYKRDERLRDQVEQTLQVAAR